MDSSTKNQEAGWSVNKRWQNIQGYFDYISGDICRRPDIIRGLVVYRMGSYAVFV